MEHSNLDAFSTSAYYHQCVANFNTITKRFDNAYNQHKTDECVCLKELSYDTDDGPIFSALVKDVKQYVYSKGYYQKCNFWIDGCNYSGEDHFKMSLKSHQSHPSGFCWASGYWKFDLPPTPTPTPTPTS